ncbi:hypothetical protein V8E53_010027, partial [Lactarius tabidus]
MDTDAADLGSVPMFVSIYEAMLSQKQDISDKMYDIAKQWISKEAATKYFNCSRATPSSSDLPLEDLLDVDTIECNHISSILTIYAMEFIANEGQARNCSKKPMHFGSSSTLSHITFNPSSMITLLLNLWLLQLLVQVEAAGPGCDPEVHTYQPCSNFLIQKSSLLQLAVEVNSTASDRPPKDQHHL